MIVHVFTNNQKMGISGKLAVYAVKAGMRCKNEGKCDEEYC